MGDTRTLPKPNKEAVQKSAARAFRQSTDGAKAARRIIKDSGYKWPEDFDPRA